MEDLPNGDVKVILSPEEYAMFQASQTQNQAMSLEFKVTLTSGRGGVMWGSVMSMSCLFNSVQLFSSVFIYGDFMEESNNKFKEDCL